MERGAKLWMYMDINIGIISRRARGEIAHTPRASEGKAHLVAPEKSH